MIEAGTKIGKSFIIGKPIKLAEELMKIEGHVYVSAFKKSIHIAWVISMQYRYIMNLLTRNQIYTLTKINEKAKKNNSN